MTPLDTFLDDIFHACALTSYIDESKDTGRHPDSEAVKRRAYQKYEAALKFNNEFLKKSANKNVK
jgi:hypothetical protein